MINLIFFIIALIIYALMFLFIFCIIAFLYNLVFDYYSLKINNININFKELLNQCYKDTKTEIINFLS